MTDVYSVWGIIELLASTTVATATAIATAIATTIATTITTSAVIRTATATE